MLQQTSISTWLRKPQTVKDLPPSSIPLSPHPSITITKSAPAAPSPLPPLPPPPPPEQSRYSAPPQAPAPPHFSQTSNTTNLPNTSNRPHLPPNITLEPLTVARLPSFKRLNALLLPIPYPPKFYDEILSDPITAGVTLVAIWHDTPPPSSSSSTTPSSSTGGDATPPPPSPPRGRLIAGIRCRLLPSLKPDTLYISTLCTLSPYRQHGVASALLRAVTQRAVAEYGVSSVTAHVWEANTEAREWYRQRGFAEEGKEEGYYRRLRPMGAVVVKKRVGVGDAVAWE